MGYATLILYYTRPRRNFFAISKDKVHAFTKRDAIYKYSTCDFSTAICMHPARNDKKRVNVLGQSNEWNEVTSKQVVKHT
jgi:hypothetical protein